MKLFHKREIKKCITGIGSKSIPDGIVLKGYLSGKGKVSCGLIWLEQSSQGYHRGPDGPMLISCGAEYNAHAANTIQPTPAETLVLMMMIWRGPKYLQPMHCNVENEK